MTDFELSDVGNGRRMIAAHGADLRYVRQWGWLVYTGGAWQRDQTGEVERRAKATVDGIFAAAAEATDSDERKRLAIHALRSQSWARIQGMIDCARSEPDVIARPEDFDVDPWLFNVQNGTVDCRTGTLRPHQRADMLTKVAPVAYDPTAEAPRFRQFVNEIMAGSTSKVALLQRAAGYSLTGSTREQKLFLACGTGANGKGAWLRTLEAAVGPYHRKADVQTFLELRSDRIREDIADLAGARIVSAEEPSKGHALDEGVVKKLTGGDTISARFLRRDRFTYRPAFKLWLAFNHKPRIHGTDHGIWRRIVLIDFPVTFDPPDETLEATMQGDELPGVLAWLVEGCRAWLRDGLMIPAEVQEATADYRAEQDVFGAFLAACCDLTPDAQERATALFAAYTAWAGRSGVRFPMNITTFGTELTERGFGKVRASGKGHTLRTGLRLRPVEYPGNGNGNGPSVNSVNSREHYIESPHMRAREGVNPINPSQPFTPFTPFTADELDETQAAVWEAEP